MRRLLAPALLLLATLAHAQDAPPSVAPPARQVGDADRYAVRLTVSTSFGDVVEKSTMTKTVVDVHDDGSADLRTTFDGATMGLTGDENPMPATATTPTVERVDAMGRAVGRALSGGFGLDPTDFALLGFPDVKDAVVGREFPLNEGGTDGKSMAGTATILDLQGSRIKIGTEFTLREGDAAPMRLKVTTTFDFATNRIVESEGELQGGLPDEGEVKVEKLKFTLTHLE